MQLNGFKIVGFYRELGHFRGVDLPSIHEARRGVRLDDAAEVCQYLMGAEWVTIVMEASADAITGRLVPGAQELAGGPSLHSDGIWVWPQDLAYYVRVYGLALPDDFLAEIRERGHRPPELTRLQHMKLRQWQSRLY
ncbi:hypothetical protein [Actinomadura rayongensis]|uniref:Uncharacterized protein n=1 Tax=Actinomadura rayongensis TaxID=1429076 RepID=A0A6I4W644_9ACTN|nr:hypothetical protein [Actinomadura rayongensis]MXQ65008.1 hypothetical protein [Actinomadura rayongensis]